MHHLCGLLADPLDIPAYSLDGVTAQNKSRDNNQNQHQKHFHCHLPRLSFLDRPIRQNVKMFAKLSFMLTVLYNMKVASFNVNSLRARLDIVLAWIAEHQPDVLCVQETKVQDGDFPSEQFAGLGYNYTFKGQKSYNGVATFSRSPITGVKFGFDDEPQDQARLIKAEINGIAIVNTYVPQGVSPDAEKFQYKLAWFDRLLTFFKKNFQPIDPVLWVGDFNVAPESIDVYDPEALLGHVCFHPEVHKALDKVLRWGFVDVFRMHCSEPGQYTFWDYRLPNSLKRNLGWRLDHIMATKSLAEKCSACYIDKEPRAGEKPSDHTPITAEFNW
jgi:exodeoxyribonuclease-3